MGFLLTSFMAPLTLTHCAPGTLTSLLFEGSKPFCTSGPLPSLLCSWKMLPMAVSPCHSSRLILTVTFLAYPVWSATSPSSSPSVTGLFPSLTLSVCQYLAYLHRCCPSLPPKVLYHRGKGFVFLMLCRHHLELSGCSVNLHR